ncbi:DNA polymerase III subunit epsilon [Lichenicola sp.]|uniref:DNA polymerase III subunit epsilon n=1 Tax=Lichenicola sp. TaxID=2804529 RepID=UPI003B00173A
MRARVLRVIDLETTGNSFTDGGVVEIGWQDLVPSADAEPRWQLAGQPQAILIDPGHPISPATAAIHHIIDEDVAGAPRWQHAAPDILRGAPGPVPLALVAHRAAFEQRWCGVALTGGLPWICTYKCALRIWPDAPSHSNQGLRYWRRPEGLDRAVGLPAHRAGPDAYVTAFHLRDMLVVASVEQLLAWSAEPALLVKVPYGRLRGRRFRDLPAEDLEQLSGGVRGDERSGERPGRQADAEIGFSARHELARRAETSAPASEPEPQPAGQRDLLL